MNSKITWCHSLGWQHLFRYEVDMFECKVDYQSLPRPREETNRTSTFTTCLTLYMYLIILYNKRQCDYKCTMNNMIY